jgi:hypothetical protein
MKTLSKLGALTVPNYVSFWLFAFFQIFNLLDNLFPKCLYLEEVTSEFLCIQGNNASFCGKGNVKPDLQLSCMPFGIL